nr:MAG TPA: hypothetical protein [Caudoviricetes sp.]
MKKRDACRVSFILLIRKSTEILANAKIFLVDYWAVLRYANMRGELL